MFTRFNALLVQYPLRVKAVSGAVLTGTGDLIAQTVESRNATVVIGQEESKRVHPLRRFVVFTLFGASWTGPVNHYWLGFLAKRFPASEGAKSVAKKLFIQHALFNPFFYLPYFFTFNGVGMGKSREELWAWVQRDYWGLLVSCWMFWMPITAGMFVVVPERFQSILMSGISLVWNSFLSWRSFRKVNNNQVAVVEQQQT